MNQRRSFLLLLPLLLLWGCPDDDCPEGTQNTAGRCVDPRSPGDATVDADIDADAEAGVDAEDCVCSGETPFCDTRSICVECRTERDCEDPSEPWCLGGTCSGCNEDGHCAHLEQTPYCDLGPARCAECLVDAHCDSGVCEGRRCLGCREDTDCGEGVCNQATNTCVGCSGDEDCSGGRCDLGTNSCVGCLGAEDCGSGNCDMETSECFDCGGDGECTMGRRCDPVRRTCVVCIGDVDCEDADAARCTEAGECTACNDSSQCTELGAPICNRGTCVECAESDDCESGVCDTTMSACVECTNDDTSACPASAPACAADNTCVTCTAADPGACSGAAPACNSATNSCVQCTASNDTGCTGSTSACDPASMTCVACTEDDQDACVGLTPVCDVPTNSCVACLVDSDCAAGTTCDEPNKACVQCTADDQSACSAAGTVCDVANKTCSATATPMSADVCEECVADEQCPDQHVCAELSFMGIDEGARCVRQRSSTAMNDCEATFVPTAMRNSMVQSLSGAEEAVCLPKRWSCTTTSTIQGGFNHPSCMGDEECGLMGLDAICEFGLCYATCSSDPDEFADCGELAGMFCQFTAPRPFCL